MKNIQSFDEFLNESKISLAVLLDIKEEADKILDDLVGKPDYQLALLPDVNPDRLYIYLEHPHYNKTDLMNISDQLIDRLNSEFSTKVHLGNFNKTHGFWLTW